MFASSRTPATFKLVKFTYSLFRSFSLVPSSFSHFHSFNPHLSSCVLSHSFPLSKTFCTCLEKQKFYFFHICFIILPSQIESGVHSAGKICPAWTVILRGGLKANYKSLIFMFNFGVISLRSEEILVYSPHISSAFEDKITFYLF